MRKLFGLLLVSGLIGALSGIISALFLWALDWADTARSSYRALVFFLPFFGVILAWCIQRLKDKVHGGNDIVIKTLLEEGPQISLWLVPVSFLGTVGGHLFGASVGQEGTAIQMGASAADAVTHGLGLKKTLRRFVLISGVAGGFGAVFGTPVAGAVFALEFTHVGVISSSAWLPAIIASCIGDLVTRTLSTRHLRAPAAEILALDLAVCAKWAAVGMVSGALAWAFVRALKFMHAMFHRAVPQNILRTGIGGCIIVCLTFIFQADAYLGGGIPLIEQAFSDPSLSRTAWLGKLVFTLVSLGAGYIGGEVTPLFVMGACLGNTLSTIFNLPLHLCVGTTMVSVFAAASKTPIAMSIMALEAMGLGIWPHAALATGIATMVSKKASIYSAQRHSKEEMNGEG